jgi:hypothetical protein
MDNLLGVMTRLAAARNLDARQAAAVEAAYFACRCARRWVSLYKCLCCFFEHA